MTYYFPRNLQNLLQSRRILEQLRAGGSPLLLFLITPLILKFLDFLLTFERYL